jgi:hypothetical protein
VCVEATPIGDLCQKIAQLEFELEQALCDEPELGKHYALGLLKRRGDSRAVRVLESYLGEGECQSLSSAAFAR